MIDCSECWRVLAASEDDTRETYEDGELEKSVEEFVEVQDVEEAA